MSNERFHFAILHLKTQPAMQESERKGKTKKETGSMEQDEEGSLATQRSA